MTAMGAGGGEGVPAANSPSRGLAVLHCTPGAARLSDAELRGHLAALPGWLGQGDRIEKTYRFANYLETIAFVNAVAYVAHREDHHPDLGVHYDRCVVAWSTHSVRGVTLNDCICAARTEQLAGRE